jgi:hypothetical protein
MESATIPVHWECEWCENQRVTALWEYNQVPLTYLGDDFPVNKPHNEQDNLKVIHWIDKNNGYVIELVLVDYGTPLNAIWEFWANDPKDVLRKVFWNFSYEPEKIVPENWTWKSQGANQEAVRCADGDQYHCLGWFYLARYGRYYLWLNFYQDTSYDVFQEIVKAIDAQFQLNIQNDAR